MMSKAKAAKTYLILAFLFRFLAVSCFFAGLVTSHSRFTTFFLVSSAILGIIAAIFRDEAEELSRMIKLD